MRSFVLGLLLFFSGSVLANQTVSCFSDVAQGRLTSTLDLPGLMETDWATNTASVAGNFVMLIDGVEVLVPMAAEFKFEARIGPDTIEGVFKIYNPYLKTEMLLTQKSATYNEIHILKNRVFADGETGFTAQPGDDWGFNIICMLD